MKPFPISNFLHMVREYEKSVGQKDVKPDDKLNDRQKINAIIQCEDYIRTCNRCDLPSTADQFERIKDAIEDDEFNLTELRKLFPELLNRLQDECERKIVLALDSHYVPFFKNAQFFDPKSGPKVSDAFPSANEDIAEAGKCLACGRATACVMHLQRVLEVGLRTLANTINVSRQNDCGKYLKEIEEELIKRMKSAGARSPEEQFYAEAHATFDSVRRAWRNPTMHPEKTYSLERAEEIVLAVRSLMRQLAIRLKEAP